MRCVVFDVQWLLYIRIWSKSKSKVHTQAEGNIERDIQNNYFANHFNSKSIQNYSCMINLNVFFPRHISIN